MVLLPYKHKAKVIERKKAQTLRKAGINIKEISHKLKVGSSTVSLRCRDIVLSEPAIQKL